MDMRCFITGYTGFIGENLLPYLHAHGVISSGFSRSAGPLSPYLAASCQSLPADLSGYDAVIHLAGKAHDTKNLARKEEYIKVNYELTKRLYNIFLQSDARKFIFLSSIKAAADHADTPLREDIKPAPASVYGQSKLMAEEYILSNLPKDGRAVYILRPCMIHGPGNKGNLNLLYKFIQKGFPIPFGAVHNDRSFLSIDNLNFLLYELMRKNISGGIYHLADNGTISTADLARLIAKNTGKKARILNIPPGVINFFAKLGDLMKLPVNSEMLAKLTGSFMVDNAKIVAALDQNLPVQLSDGLIKTVHSFKNH